MIRLSPTTGLSLFNDCPKCFWLHFNKNIHRPRGIFPSLPGGMDLVIKDYFDVYRKKNALPPEIDGKVEGKLIDDVELLTKWRNWRIGLEYARNDIGATLCGAIDDCLIVDGRLIPLDYKTKGSAPVAGDSEKYYTTQLDSYALMMRESGYPVGDFGYLVYYYPKKVSKNGAVKFGVEPVRIEVNADRVKNLFEKAVATLKGEMPQHHSKCEYCFWLSGRKDFE